MKRLTDTQWRILTLMRKGAPLIRTTTTDHWHKGRETYRCGGERVHSNTVKALVERGLIAPLGDGAARYVAVRVQPPGFAVTLKEWDEMQRVSTGVIYAP